jgi:hypothetical protein
LARRQAMHIPTLLSLHYWSRQLPLKASMSGPNTLYWEKARSGLQARSSSKVPIAGRAQYGQGRRHSAYKTPIWDTRARGLPTSPPAVSTTISVWKQRYRQYVTPLKLPELMPLRHLKSLYKLFSNTLYIYKSAYTCSSTITHQRMHQTYLLFKLCFNVNY